MYNIVHGTDWERGRMTGEDAVQLAEEAAEAALKAEAERVAKQDVFNKELQEVGGLLEKYLGVPRIRFIKLYRFRMEFPDLLHPGEVEKMESKLRNVGLSVRENSSTSNRIEFANLDLSFIKRQLEIGVREKVEEELRGVRRR